MGIPVTLTEVKRAVVVALAVVLAGCAPREMTLEDDALLGPTAATTTTLATTTTTTTTTTIPTTTTTTLVPSDGLTAAERVLAPVHTIGGQISPKSVVASQTGLFFAQNMMYRHTITVYDRDFDLLATIDDRVTPSDFGHEEFDQELRGSPVEAAFTSDGSMAYVSNYKMYGGGLSTAASDGCNQGNWPDSFVYGIDTSSLEVERVIRVGPVPKFLAVTPDDRLLVVANWCGFDVSVIDLASGLELGRVPVGRHPRGVAITPDSSVAYVAVMGSTRVGVIDLDSLEVSYLEGIGRSPRHLVLSPDGSILYVSLNGEGRIASVDTTTGDVLAKVATGSAPRSMEISDDGSALYVVNYNSNSLSVVRTGDLTEVAEHRTNVRPIGVTYDAATRRVWVANYSGSIQVFEAIAP
jgi:DNA-binding beta-propeller fold protein YncE